MNLSRHTFLSMLLAVVVLPHVAEAQMQPSSVRSALPARSAAPARSALPARSAIPARSARPASMARPPFYHPHPGPYGPRPIAPVRVNGDLVVGRTPDGRPVPMLPPRIVIVSSPEYRKLVASGLHDTHSPSHVAQCPECRALVDKETLRHLDAWWVGEQGRRLNARLNGLNPPPPPRHHRKRHK